MQSDTQCLRALVGQWTHVDIFFVTGLLEKLNREAAEFIYEAGLGHEVEFQFFARALAYVGDEKAEDFLAAEKIQVPPEFIKNARRFMYYNLYRYCLPFGDYLENDGVWPGYVALKPFDYRALLAENSPTLRVIVEGILRDKPFIIIDD